MTNDSAVKVCGDQSVDQVLDQQLTRPEEESKEEEYKVEVEKVNEHKVTFWMH
jgi:hypothetical protein